MNNIDNIEKWNDIPNYEGVYQVSNLGNVKSLKRIINWNNTFRNQNEKILIGRNDGKGYLSVILQKDNISQSFKIHQLVAMAFLNHIPSKHSIVVDHKNNIKNDNRLENLQLITNRENCSKDKKRNLPIGVVYHKKNMKFQAQIRHNGKNKYLGQFNTALEASEAYNKALKNLIYDSI